MQSVQGFQGAVSGNNIQGGKGHLNFKHQYLVVTEAWTAFLEFYLHPIESLKEETETQHYLLLHLLNSDRNAALKSFAPTVAHSYLLSFTCS